MTQMPNKTIYLDYAATTPVDKIVAKKMAEYLTFDGVFANPASRAHIFGWQAEEAIENARRQVADLIHADPREIVWTSGATESNNLAIKGVVNNALANQNLKSQTKLHIITSAIEHKAVLDPCVVLSKDKNVEITYLQPDASGKISLVDLKNAIKPHTVLVSLMHVNNEIGVINPLEAIGKICCENNILFHVDAAQGASRLAINVQAMNIDLLSLSAHKFYGPKGVGALFIRRSSNVNVSAQIHGGGHERGYRSGTLPTHQIVGMGEAAHLLLEYRESDTKKAIKLRTLFLERIAVLDSVVENAIQVSEELTKEMKEMKVPSIINLGFKNIDGETLLMSLPQLAISTGSACMSASVEPSYVLKAIGVSDDIAHSSLRFSIGRYTTQQDIITAANVLTHAVQHLQSNKTQKNSAKASL